MWDLLDVENKIGISLTESLAMSPASSVSGMYFANPNAYYFSVDEICRDQVQSYAARKQMTEAQVEKWCAPILSYMPE